MSTTEDIVQIKTALASPSSCAPHITELLTELLDGTRTKQQLPAATKSNKPTAQKSTIGVKSRATSKINVASVEKKEQELKPSERARLATEVVNICLKSLSQEVQSRAQYTITLSPKESTDRVLTSRSINVPPSPTKSAKNSISTKIGSNGVKSVAESARLALSSLRKQDLPSSQIESAMSALVSKLIALDMIELACKEVRILAQRLDMGVKQVASPKGKVKRGIDTSGTQSAFLSLLSLASQPDSAQKLSLVITTQLHILRLLRFTKTIPDPLALYELLKFESQSSPINLIEVTLTTEGKDKCSRQLTALAHALMAVSDRIASKIKQSPCTKVDPAEGVLRLRVLSLEILWKSWQTTGHKIEIRIQLCQPFKHYVEDYLSQTQVSTTTRFEVVDTSVETIMTLARSLSLSTQQKQEIDLARLDFGQILQSLSKSAGKHKRSKQLANQALERLANVEVSSARRATILCQAALSMMQDTKSVPGQDLCQLLEKVVNSYSSSVDGSSEELDELLMSITSLRKTAMKFLGERRPDSAAEGSIWTVHITNCISKALTFMLRYVGNPPDTKSSGNATIRYQKRRLLASKMARATIESFVLLAKQAVDSSLEAWTDYERQFANCIILAESLDLDNFNDVADVAKGHTPIRILISNVFWCRYLGSRDSSTERDILVKLLEQSTTLLEHLTIPEQKIGLFATKLERLGHVYEQCQDWPRASHAYQQAWTSLVKSGWIHEMADKFRWVPLLNAILEDPKLRVVGKVIEGYCRMQIHSDKTPPLRFDEDLSPTILGLILELQLSYFGRLRNTNSNELGVNQAMRDLGRTLLGIYTEADFPIRRLRAISTMAECDIVLDQPHTSIDESLELNMTEQILLPFHDHLVARRNAILSIKQMQQSRLLTTALQQWLNLVSHKSIVSWQTLVNRIGDVRGWHELLNTIAAFTDAYGLAEQRIASLDLLGYSLQLSTSFDLNVFSLHSVSLTCELLSLGFTTDASTLLQRSRKIASDDTGRTKDSFDWNIAQAEYCLAVNSLPGAQAAISTAQQLTHETDSAKSQASSIDSLRSKAQVHYLNARYQSLLGRLSNSIFHIKQSVKCYLQAWAFVERKYEKLRSSHGGQSLDDKRIVPDAEFDDRSAFFNLSGSSNEATDSTHFWPMIRPLFESLLYSSTLHLQSGLITEGRYYLQEALKIAQTVTSPAFIVRSLTCQASLETRCGNNSLGKSLSEKARELLVSAKNIGGIHSTLLQAECALHWSEHDDDCFEEIDQMCQMLDNIRTPCLLLPSSLKTETEELIEGIGNLKIDNKEHKLSRAASVKTSKPKAKSSKDSVTRTSTMVKDGRTPLQRIKRKLLLLKADIISRNAEEAESLATADEILQSSTSDECSIQQSLIQGNINLKKGLQALTFDPVLNIIPETILAQPAVSSTKSWSSKQAPTRVSKKVISTASKRKQVESDVHCLHFNNAVACCASNELTSASRNNTVDMHSLAELRIKSCLTLAAVAPASQILDVPTSRLAGQLEFGRNHAYAAMQAVIEADKRKDDNDGVVDITLSTETNSDAFDMDQFQSEYIDIIPSDWHVVSLSINEDQKEIRLGAFRSTAVPLVLSIPLNRDSRDGEDNGFTFDQGKKELLRFIDLANYSTHESVNLSKKGAKSEWWEIRAGLDSKLRDLLINIENIWLGGFKGMLLHCPLDEELMIKFGEAFTKTLNKYLPSRQSRKPMKPTPIVLHSRILELFLRLGNPLNDENIHEPILDLLYFVIDTLWFNGERNACDEIDFDPMVLEIQDALISYHETINQNNDQSSRGHTILILDKNLHSFPWESLPCMKGQSVSRLPSMYSLRQRILQMDNQASLEDMRFAVEKSDGSFILNPSGDLKNTQITFERPLSCLDTWTSRINTIPSEADISAALSTKPLYLYFGHGSGGQYIRSRSIRRLDQCAVALLMGCSSGTLTEAGKYESYGTPLNYLHAGAPAVVGTLWDVTDKDIDRFSLKMLERWGLINDNDTEDGCSPIKKTPKARGKSKQKDVQTQGSANGPPVALDTAIAEARESCIMRYLNGAAPVVYGIPVFLR